MENAILVGLSRQVALARELDVIANNVANIGTNGFKASQVRFEEYLGSGAKADAFEAPDRKVSFVLDRGSTLDLSAGPLEQTGSPLDVAIRGDGMFVVNTPEGERYTRNGSLEIDPLGQLVTSDGHPLLGQSGPFQFDAGETQITIAADGTVSSSLGEKGKIRLVATPDPRQLENRGGNLFSSSTPLGAAGPAIRVQSGFVERSNVQPVLAMSRLIEVNRAYSSISSMLQKNDDLRRSALQQLANLPN
jgi:flagellar basal-body rod protein FlgF